MRDRALCLVIDSGPSPPGLRIPFKVPTCCHRIPPCLGYDDIKEFPNRKELLKDF